MTPPKALGPDIQKLYTYHELPIGATAIGLPPGRTTGLWRYTKPAFQVKIPPCQYACPAGNWIQKFIAETGSENLDDAWKALILENPFPDVCGRVCYHPCELSCIRKDLDSATSIHSAERFLADHFFRQPLAPPRIREKQNKKIAVVGSGPAGLACVYFLIMMGYETTVFEANNELGGMPLIGIPRYRLPKKILDKEIGGIIALGVEVKKGCRVGQDLPFEELLAYDAVFLGTGAHQATQITIPVNTKANIYQGLDFLAQNNRGRPLELGQNVLVIGGGNVAIDHYLRGDDLQDLLARGAIARTMRAHFGIEEMSSAGEREVATYQELNLTYTCSATRNTSEKLPVGERICGFSEVDCGLNETSAVQEAQRCLSCGVCRMCGNCYLFCPDGAVEFDPTSEQYRINYEYCKGCGICFKECPVGTICVRTEEEV